MAHIYVDADACPVVKQIENSALCYNMEHRAGEG